MNRDVVIRVEKLGKCYQLGNVVDLQRSFRETLMALTGNLFQRARRFSRMPSSIGGQGTDKNEAETLDSMYDPGIPSGTFWALQDVSFEVKAGEVIGIIGRNGAGKSTLLKILSRIVIPTTGHAEIHGRTGSLLEVGTGFHPELSGRENIYLNGAILGMRKAEIESNFDDIVSFAEVERFIDTPVKRYSSGMRVRLAFAVAAHLDPEILIIDEVLAVGDAAFQKKCLGKMGDVARHGRTVLFVSHNMAAVEKLCSRALLISQGRIVMDDTSSKTVACYMQNKEYSYSAGHAYGLNTELLQSVTHEDFRLTDIELLTLEGQMLDFFGTGDSCVLRIHYEARRQFAMQAFAVHVKNSLGVEVFRLNTTPISGYHIEQLGKRGYVDMIIYELPLTAGRYFFDVGFVREKTEWIIRMEGVLYLDVSPKDIYGSGMAIDSSRGVCIVKHAWEHVRLQEM